MLYCGEGIKLNFWNFLIFGMCDLIISRKEYKLCIKIWWRVYIYIVINLLYKVVVYINFLCVIFRDVDLFVINFLMLLLFCREILVYYNKFRY